jgi:hypothetical protein
MTKPIKALAYLTESEAQVLENIGLGTSNGIKLALAWVSHFYNCGLRPDMDLQRVGLSIMVNPEISEDLKQWLDNQRLDSD